jgi:putative oxidoreductase
MRSTLYLGRWLFALLFIETGYSHLTKAAQAYALSFGIPPWMTIAAGIMACVGGLCVATGFRAREGAVLIAGFLAPVTLVMHRFWTVQDPAQHAAQMANFMKNLSLFGAALMIVYLGSSPWSGDTGVPDAKARTRRVTTRELLTPGSRL